MVGSGALRDRTHAVPQRASKLREKIRAMAHVNKFNKVCRLNGHTSFESQWKLANFANMRVVIHP